MSTHRSPRSLFTGATMILASVAVLTGCAAAAPAPSTGDASPGATTASTIQDGGTTADRTDSATENANLAIVTRLITDAFADPSSTTATGTAEELVAADALAHGDGLAPGPDGLLAQFTAAHTRIPGAQAVIKHTAADGDLVAVHYQITATPDDERTGEAAVDLFRVTDGTVVERWSFDQTVPTGTPASGNTNTMFSDLYEPTDDTFVPTEEQEEANRELAVGAYNTLFRDQDPSILDTAFDPAYLQHNSVAPNGTEALKSFFSGGAAFPPNESVISLSDGDLVWTFSQPVGAASGDAFVAADIFRVDENLIREHWDVVPTTPAS
ncbi:nuclear transport factor 2 family protein [Microbacterium sp. cx-59]|uniref:nuclear transport factor 2 family protein n=1 Tax=Microbacterium sp. cx-59 TaxID=2891207 RepID=UPI001E536C93|nr:nuclear transport factor 2 family protein [Microbacterium sp. cx-59]MCC4908818.1 nuclear transport factor 2 family protein [Microbacterium sp. cx-59]